MLAWALLLALPGAQAESWSDARLTVRDGLALWLDAGKQDAAHAAAQRAPPADGAELGVWYDASGRGRHFVQRERAAQPRLVGTLVRFDGVDDVLQCSGGAATLGDFTLFVRALARSNGGGFRGFVASNALGRNDYQSGFTVDLSWAPSARLETINVEGAGFGGAIDLLAESPEFGTFHTIAVTAVTGARGVALHFDGREQGRRDRAAAPLAALHVDELSVGARFYSNTSDVPCATGFLDGDVEEVLLYERALSAAERAEVERYLATKWAPIEAALAKSTRLHRVPLVPVKPAPVEFMVPGFTARALPVNLTNVNNVRYREDGKLVALGYDGNVWLLEDRDGDGLEETTRLFFENQGSLAAPIGMALTPPGYARGRGLFVACKGKVVLLADQDGDDVAEKEIVVASGWAPGAIQHNVDALGVALAPDGRLFFGLGTSDYTNGYLIDAQDGKRAAHYDLASERGTILEVAPDFTTRRIHCTGIRFPVALAFNRAGDLFATDQEGATWLANGNPFDELLHIEEGRHYGFPPRHPVHLPGVIDEPSVFDYGPQHESTCGLCFDEPAESRGGGARAQLFGPASFAGNALVAGYSRGKLYRTELVKSCAGYVARTQLFARFDQLPCDLCLAPSGALIVAAHGGAPDWGSGPAGHGTLWRLDWKGEQPLPLFAWAAGPDEVRVAFDRPLDAERWQGAAARSRITFGEAVAPGDRFEVQRPGYAVVERQLAAPRHDLPVRSLRLLDGGRTLSLRTEPHARLVPHALELPGIDLAYELHGVAAEWRAHDGGETWSGWLPHLDLTVARALTAGSVEHDRLWRLVKTPGSLKLECELDLDDMLRPRVQPGATLDYTRSDEQIDFNLIAPPAFIVHDTLKPQRGRPEPLRIEVATGDPKFLLDAWWSDESGGIRRPFELRRFVLPWANRLDESVGAAVDSAAAAPARPELAGGNWSRGRAVFFGEDAMCSRCHTLRDGSGRGARGRIGPDLSQVWQRDFASLRNDVLAPSAAIHPDHLAYAIRLADGRELVGVPRDEQDAAGRATIVVGEAGGKETTIRSADIVKREPLPISIMPSGLQNVLSAQQVQDLLTYLLTPPLAPAPIAIAGAPPPRALAEVEAALGRPPTMEPKAPPPLRIVLVAGPKDHGTNEHDYPDWQQRWSRLLALADGVDVATADGWPSAAQLANAHVLVVYSANPAWGADARARAAELDAFLARGGGVVLLHYAVNGHDAVPGLAQRTGLAWRDGASRFRHGAVDLELAPAAAAHPITRGLAGLPLRFVDETYWSLEGDPAEITPLATSLEEGGAQPQLWTREAGGGRLFVSLLGHYRRTFDDPLFRLLVLRAIAWSAAQPVDRLAELATVGARLAGE